MRSDQITKVLLALIAAGLWVLALTQVGSPVGEAQAGVPAAALEQSRQEFASPPPGTFPTRTGTSTRPLRWRVRHALLHNPGYTDHADCFTIASVRNFGPAATTVDVESYYDNKLIFTSRYTIDERGRAHHTQRYLQRVEHGNHVDGDVGSEDDLLPGVTAAGVLVLLLPAPPEQVAEELRPLLLEARTGKIEI